MATESARDRLRVITECIRAPTPPAMRAINHADSKSPNNTQSINSLLVVQSSESTAVIYSAMLLRSTETPLFEKSNAYAAQRLRVVAKAGVHIKRITVRSVDMRARDSLTRFYAAVPDNRAETFDGFYAMTAASQPEHPAKARTKAA